MSCCPQDAAGRHRHLQRQHAELRRQEQHRRLPVFLRQPEPQTDGSRQQEEKEQICLRDPWKQPLQHGLWGRHLDTPVSSSGAVCCRNHHFSHIGRWHEPTRTLWSTLTITWIAWLLGLRTMVQLNCDVCLNTWAGMPDAWRDDGYNVYWRLECCRHLQVVVIRIRSILCNM